jgi:predicted nucleic acid-binding protein
MYFVDTDIIIDLTKTPPREEALRWLQGIRERPKVCQAVALEVLQGARNKDELRNCERFLNKFERVYHTKKAQKVAEDLVREFKLSHGLGIQDALIAATVMVHRATLLTLNEKHFRAIAGLSYQVPYRKG